MKANMPEPTPDVPHGVQQEMLFKAGSLLDSIDGDDVWDQFAKRMGNALLAGPGVTNADFNKCSPRWVEMQGMAEAAHKLVTHFRNLRAVCEHQRQMKEGA